MIYFFETLRRENSALFWFGAINLIAAFILVIISQFSKIEIYGINAWYKPIKFCLSTTCYSWAIAWYIRYLANTDFNLNLFNLIIITTLGFEVIYITLQAGRGQLSHYNQSTNVYRFLYMMMALAATVATAWTGYVGYLFFKNSFPNLPVEYLWSIRIGIIIFVIFAFEGFVMGSRLTHTIGGPDGGPGLPFLNWSTQFGDPRIAHFIGMHALQVIPLLSFYVIKNTKLTMLIGVFYFFLAVLTLIQALNGHPLLRVTKN